MKLSVFILGAALAIAPAAWGQTAPDPASYGPITPTPAAMAHARHMMEVMHMDRLVDQITRQMSGPMMANMLKSLPPEKREAGEAMQASILEDTRAMTLRMSHSMVEVYARNLTEKELADIDAFYSGPSGQAVLAKMPALTAKLMPDMQAELPIMMRHAFDRFCSRTTCTTEDRAAMDKVVQSFGAAGRAAS